MNARSPIVSEFESFEDEDAYSAWLQAKVHASLADVRPGIPHDQVMAEMESLLVAAEVQAPRAA